MIRLCIYLPAGTARTECDSIQRGNEGTYVRAMLINSKAESPATGVRAENSFVNKYQRPGEKEAYDLSP
jgi:hypothetical protein